MRSAMALKKLVVDSTLLHHFMKLCKMYEGTTTGVGNANRISK